MLAYDFETVNPPQFKQELRRELSDALRIDIERVKIESIAAGSVVVVIAITGALIALAIGGFCAFGLTHKFSELNLKTYMALSALFGLSFGAAIGECVYVCVYIVF